jgi:hypothetical protein
MFDTQLYPPSICMMKKGKTCFLVHVVALFYYSTPAPFALYEISADAIERSGRWWSKTICEIRRLMTEGNKSSTIGVGQQ